MKLKENDKIILKDGTEAYYIYNTADNKIIIDYPSHKDENGLLLYDQAEIDISAVDKIIND